MACRADEAPCRLKITFPDDEIYIFHFQLFFVKRFYNFSWKGEVMLMLTAGTVLQLYYDDWIALVNVGLTTSNNRNWPFHQPNLQNRPTNDFLPAKKGFQGQNQNVLCGLWFSVNKIGINHLQMLLDSVELAQLAPASSLIEVVSSFFFHRNLTMGESKPHIFHQMRIDISLRWNPLICKLIDWLINSNHQVPFFIQYHIPRG